ncbi:hypothetical protein SDC9_202822 [bioreactor metagenome]|uniref:Uncharacterized protein n=1 Tax=bioreactor metagenome TaxID=1076179 RepID=A0A645J6N8_9ZZZZ
MPSGVSNGLPANLFAEALRDFRRIKQQRQEGCAFPRLVVEPAETHQWQPRQMALELCLLVVQRRQNVV